MSDLILSEKKILKLQGAISKFMQGATECIVTNKLDDIGGLLQNVFDSLPPPQSEKSL